MRAAVVGHVEWIRFARVDRVPATGQIAHAFDRFWQGPEGTGSSGLGLAIVAKLVHADGGRVTLADAPGGGLDAAVSLPAAPPATGRTS